MLKITPDDVALLSDTDLRTLIGLFCESELRSRELSAAAVTWSGHQNSADGGLDVRVSLEKGEAIEGFVARPQAGFQVKKSPMPSTEILVVVPFHLHSPLALDWYSCVPEKCAL
jgi:hypothetical protein